MDKYEEALERAKEWEREHPNGYVIRDMMEHIFPGYNDSEDEMIRQTLIDMVKRETGFTGFPSQGQVLTYLEKKKEQKPAEWSEEDETCLEYALWCVMKTRHFVAKDACDLDACRCAERWLNSLRPCPQPHWKPSEEQMEALKEAIYLLDGSEYSNGIDSLYNDLNKLK